MLARLEDLDEVDRAETDVAGEHLRLTMRRGSGIVAARELLAALGYVAVEATADPKVRWYDRQSVGELSRVEAHAIAERVLAQLRRSRQIDAALVRSLGVVVVEALHRCLLDSALTSSPTDSLRRRCIDATREAVTAVASDALGRAVADLVASDMSEDHRTSGSP